MNHAFVDSGNSGRKKIDSLPGDVCGINGDGHTWDCQPYCRGISRGACNCGAVRFFATVYAPEYITLRDHYNTKHGKPGKVYSGPSVNISRKINQIVNQKEENMVVQIPAKELPPDMKEKLGINKAGTALVEDKIGETQYADSTPGGVMPKASSKDYTREEKLAIVAEGKAAGTKAGRRKVAAHYNINLYQLHAWDMNFDRASHPGEKKELSPAQVQALANASAARKSKAAAALIADAVTNNKAPAAPPAEEFICLADCQRGRDKCNFIAKSTAGPDARKCLGYIPPPAEKFYCLGDDCVGGDCAAANVKGTIIAPWDGEGIPLDAKPCPAAKQMEPLKIYCLPDCLKHGTGCMLQRCEGRPVEMTSNKDDKECPSAWELPSKPAAPPEKKKFLCFIGCPLWGQSCGHSDYPIIGEDLEPCPEGIFELKFKEKEREAKPAEKISPVFSNPDNHVATITIGIDADTTAITAKLEDLKRKTEEFNSAAVAILPKPRWWWTPSVWRKYLDSIVAVSKAGK
jgi:transposase-like protein